MFSLHRRVKVKEIFASYLVGAIIVDIIPPIFPGSEDRMYCIGMLKLL